VKKSVLTVLVFLAAFSLASKATPAAAQTFGVGWQLLDDTTGSETFPLGLDGNVSFPFMGPWSWVGDVSWNHKSVDDVSLTFLNVGVGAKFTFPSVKALSVQGLVGIDHSTGGVNIPSQVIFGVTVPGSSVSSSETDLMIQPGVIYTIPAGGIDVFVGGHFRHVFVSGGDDAFIVQAGVMFGKK
jgi:hypothetical protein